MTKMSTEAFQEVVLSKFDTATDQRKEDKKDIHKRMDRMEEKHTETYSSVFNKIEDNGKNIATNEANIKNNQKKSVGIGGASGLGGGAIILFAKELYNSFISGN